MRITIIAVGQRQPAWALTAVDDYLARFPADFKVDLKEVKAEPRSGKSNDPVQRHMVAEAARIRAASPADARFVALDERGHDWATDKLAATLGQWRDAGAHPVFVIGGPDGLDAGFKQAAHTRLRLSSMTLPHALARVLLAEQLYRAWSILANHPYHRA
ncbi:MAG: 23S rRNA (pseudouridine(1915)-N(3))-methyltransferase RlmH [Burkholderiaceae bacterium]